MARKTKKRQVSMFPAGEDLPLFTGVCITVHFKPFGKGPRPPIPYLQLKFDVLLTPLQFEELAERYKQWQALPLPAEDPTKPRLL